MNVKLISITVPTWHEAQTPEHLITYCARVSSPQNQLNTDTAPKLIRYLIEHKHWSPFEMASMCVEIETSRAISAQILRHRSFSFQEFSQRYSEVTEFEEYEGRAPAEKNRQSSVEPLSYHQRIQWEAAYQRVTQTCFEEYRTAINNGVAREQARMLLPMCTKTRLYMNGTVRSWIHYLQVRCAPDVQKEHRDIAEACKAIFTTQFPIIAEALWG